MSTLRDSLERALELAQIIENIIRATISGEITPQQAEEIINEMMKG